MNRTPIGQAGIFGIVRSWRVFKTGDPGVVDHHVADRNMPGERSPVRLFTYVERHESAAQRCGGRFARRSVDVGQDDFGAFADEGFADGAANSARCAGDDAGLSHETGHENSFRIRSIGQARHSAAQSGKRPPRRCHWTN